jgi:para-aminobenzoate synthetase/4-amino-4-deoxychorismate lyase
MPDPRAGVFETLLMQHDRVVNADAHVARLADSVRELYDVPLDSPALERRLLGLESAGHGYRRIRLTFRPDLAEVEWSMSDISLRSAGPWHLVPRDLPGGLGRHKWVDRAALQDPTGVPWPDDRDPLLVDRGGQVLETGRGNIFLVVSDIVHTPRSDDRILPGVVRSQVLDLVRRRGLDVLEGDLSLEDLGGADEVFVTNSIGGVRPVADCVGVGEWRPGPFAAQIRSDVEAAWHPRARGPGPEAD